jgi:hypothetical protein
MTITGHISRILVFISLIVALWLGAAAMIAATVSPAGATATTQLAEEHGGCC